MTKPFDPTKPVRTRSGLEVKLFSEYRGDEEHPLIGVVKERDGSWTPRTWAADGQALVLNGVPTGYDLVNVPERRSGWINIYSKEELQATKDEAERVAVGNRLACIYVEFEEGGGLSND